MALRKLSFSLTLWIPISSLARSVSPLEAIMLSHVGAQPPFRFRCLLRALSSGLKFENSNEIGVFAKLTNAYCLTAIGASENFYRQVMHVAASRRLCTSKTRYNFVPSIQSPPRCVAPALSISPTSCCNHQKETTMTQQGSDPSRIPCWLLIFGAAEPYHLLAVVAQCI